jgi:hypothetical protein
MKRFWNWLLNILFTEDELQRLYEEMLEEEKKKKL